MQFQQIQTLFLLLVCMAFSWQSIAQITPPDVAKKPKQLEKHGQIRTDDYYWLNERENPEVIAYLEAENAYAEQALASADDLRKNLFQEIKGRIKETDLSVPYFLNAYFYYSRFEEGKEYPIYCRKKGSLDAAEEIMVDVNQMAEGHEFYSLFPSGVSDDNQWLALLIDTVGRRQYTLMFKNLLTGEVLSEQIPHATSVAWAADNKTVFYGVQNTTTLRDEKIYKHVLGTPSSQDVLIFEEKDETFYTNVYRSKSKEYIIIYSQSTVSSEYQLLKANNPTGQFQVFYPRERDHLYSVDHYQDAFYVLTNWEALNFRLMTTTTNPADWNKTKWKNFIAHRPDVLIEDIEIFKDFLVLEERQNGLAQIRIMPWNGTGEHYLDFGEPTYLAYLSTNPEFDTPLLRFSYTSLTMPNSTYDYDMNTRNRVLLKQQEVLGGFNAADYQAERIYATAADGTRIPISLVYKKGLVKDGNNPLWLNGYGSYGISSDATFSLARLSLLNRGFVFAIAHIRGGQEMGRQWYEDGKMFKKMNTFTDFIACADYLVQQQYTNPQKMFAQGGSAGGLLMGAVINLRPDLFKGVIAQVPFVDVVTTMLDESIPLTTGEYDEWGNPNNLDSYNYMLSYSPYDNIAAKAYPNLLVTTGLHDSQVQYFEPAKWVAKLRDVKTDNNLLILKTDMSAGHGGKSGRFKSLEDVAYNYAFVLSLLGITE